MEPGGKREDVSPLVTTSAGADCGDASPIPSGDGESTPPTGVFGPEDPMLFGDLIPLGLPMLDIDRRVLPPVNPPLVDAGDAKPSVGNGGLPIPEPENDELGELVTEAEFTDVEEGDRAVSSLMSIKGLGLVNPGGGAEPLPALLELTERGRDDREEFDRAEPGRRGGRSVAKGASSSSESDSVVEWELDGCEVENRRES